MSDEHCGAPNTMALPVSGKKHVMCLRPAGHPLTWGHRGKPFPRSPKWQTQCWDNQRSWWGRVARTYPW